MKSSKVTYSLIAVLVVALAAALTYSIDLNRKIGNYDSAPSYLWSQTATSGSLIGPDDENLTLTLTDADVFTNRFTDRPLRDAYVVNNVDFAKRWKGYFADSAPNAVLSFETGHGERPLNIILTLTSASWNAEAKSWTFNAKRIREKADNLPDSTVIAAPAVDNPAKFVGATLFIDNSCTADDFFKGRCTGFWG